MYYARTGWLALALVPTQAAFLLLVSSDSKAALTTATAMIGLSSGFVFSAAVSITAELFGPNRAGVNHNVLITNIPLGSLGYSLLAALIYEANIGNSDEVVSKDGSKNSGYVVETLFIERWVLRFELKFISAGEYYCNNTSFLPSSSS
ncbi:protein NUCLEAR FUSION defective [Sesamum alatum]|uniref:Protein NUCLEAR FUSION defective n=1 Tax=Sesamum alatum TaxID=300844 RepID=A0AAE2CBJ9_9LAMI|nr:protein NUCLEAR FUSION defective [Sesamum alatum]